MKDPNRYRLLAVAGVLTLLGILTLARRGRDADPQPAHDPIARPGPGSSAARAERVAAVLAPPNAPAVAEPLSEGAQATVLEAQRRVRQQLIDAAIANFERFQNSKYLIALAEMRLPPNEALPLFLRLLAHPDAGARAMAMYGLSRLGAAAAPAVSAMVARYEADDEDEEVVWRAAVALAAIGPAAAAATDPLIRRLAGSVDSPRVRHASIIALAKIGPAARAAIPILEREIGNADSRMAYDAYLAIGTILNAPPLDDGALRAVATDTWSVAMSFRAFESIRRAAVTRETGLATIHAFLAQPRSMPETVLAVDTLGQLEPSDPESVAVLLRVLASPDELVAQTAATALAKLRPIDARARDLLGAAVTAPEDAVSIESSRALARFGQEAASFLPPIIDALDACNGATSHRRIGGYLDVLRAVGPPASAATAMLTRMLAVNADVYQGRGTDAAMEIRKYVLFTLADVGVTRDAIPAIVDVLENDRHPMMLAAAARAAGALREGQNQVVPFLLRPLRPGFRDELTNLHPIDSRFIPDEGTQTSARLEAIRALARLGPAAKLAIPLLRDRAADETRGSFLQPRYQEEAAQAAEKLSS